MLLLESRKNSKPRVREMLDCETCRGISTIHCTHDDGKQSFYTGDEDLRPEKACELATIGDVPRDGCAGHKFRESLPSLYPRVVASWQHEHCPRLERGVWRPVSHK